MGRRFPVARGCAGRRGVTQQSGVRAACGRSVLSCTTTGGELSADDRTAASLLRPRIGWGNSVGSVSGRLEVEGAAAPYVHVYAIRSTAAGMRDPVGAFANVRGEFLIEGLPPGEYILWALPVRYYWNHHHLVLEGAATDLKDAVVAHPVRVEAGRVTDGIEIPMRSGRQ